MSEFQVIPAIDLRGGKCVRLFQGDYELETVFSEDPVAVARQWIDEGARRIHLVDLDGAASGRGENRAVVAAIAAEAGRDPGHRVLVDLGGGIRDLEDIETVLALGVGIAIIGTAAVTTPDFVARAAAAFPGHISVGIDARDGQVAVKGWTEQTDLSALDLARRVERDGAAEIIVTDIGRDATLTEPNYALIADMVAAVTIPVVASGGVARSDQLSRLRDAGAAGVIIGMALYTGAVTLDGARQALAV